MNIDRTYSTLQGLLVFLTIASAVVGLVLWRVSVRRDAVTEATIADLSAFKEGFRPREIESLASERLVAALVGISDRGPIAVVAASSSRESVDLRERICSALTAAGWALDGRANNPQLTDRGAWLEVADNATAPAYAHELLTALRDTGIQFEIRNSTLNVNERHRAAIVIGLNR